MPSKPDDRATTLKKIDEIEAQMSMQWWKTKHGDPSSRSGSSTNFPMSSQMPPEVSGRPPGAPLQRSTAHTRTDPAPLQQSPSDEEGTSPVGLSPTDADDDTGRSPLMPASSGSSSSSLHAPPSSFAAHSSLGTSSEAASRAGPPSGPASGSNSASFSASKLFAIDVDEFAHDPELEEASIRFANGDDSGAESGLIEVLGPQGARIDHDETWLTLFDLYRATGRQDRFETAAIDFAGRFGRSAPQWFSIPEAVGRMQAAPAAPTGGANQPVAHWTCPATLGTQTVVAMNVALSKATPPLRLSWVKLNAIDEAAMESLTRLFTQWAGRPVQLRFIGADNLEKVLKNSTPSGDRGVNPNWWKLRMEVLRVMHRPDEFELVALDYCVTYEVSPPSWDSARCEFKRLQEDGSFVTGQTLIGEAFRDSLSSGMNMGYSDTHAASLNSQMSNISTVELAGQILGDATEALDILENKLVGADVMIISCARLIRIDFSAAGTLLNWVTARQAEGRQVQFVEVHRLVAAFFNVIGIGEHARVIARVD
ncbi:MAG: STAS domain-containing protein, partial [Ramlibacter sp.]